MHADAISLASVTRRHHAQHGRFGRKHLRTHKRGSTASHHSRKHLALIGEGQKLRKLKKTGKLMGSASPKDWRKKREMCSIRNNPNCGALRDKLLPMQTGVSDKVEQMQDNLVLMDSTCRATKANFEAQVEAGQTRLKDEQAALAGATKAVIEAEEQTRLKSQELQQLVT